MALTGPIIDAISVSVLYVVSTICYLWIDGRLRESFSFTHPYWLVLILFAASNALAFSFFIACEYGKLGGGVAADLSLFFCDIWKALSLWGINAIEVYSSLYCFYSGSICCLRVPLIIVYILEAVEITGSVACMIVMPRIGSAQRALLSIPSLSMLPAVDFSALVSATTHLSALGLILFALFKNSLKKPKYNPRLLLSLASMLLIIVASIALVVVAHLGIFTTSTAIQGALCIIMILPRVYKMYKSNHSRLTWPYRCSRLGGPAGHESLNSVAAEV